MNCFMLFLVFYPYVKAYGFFIFFCFVPWKLIILKNLCSENIPEVDSMGISQEGNQKKGTDRKVSVFLEHSE